MFQRVILLRNCLSQQEVLKKRKKKSLVFQDMNFVPKEPLQSRKKFYQAIKLGHIDKATMYVWLSVSATKQNIAKCCPEYISSFVEVSSCV